MKPATSDKRRMLRSCPLGRVAAYLAGLLLLAASWAHANQTLIADVRNVVLRTRTAVPIIIEIHLKYTGRPLQEGQLRLEVRDGLDLQGWIETGKIVLSPPKPGPIV